MSKKKEKTNAEKTQEGLDFSAKVLEFGREQGREEMRNSKCPSCGDCCNGHVETDLKYEKRKKDYPSIDGEVIVGYTLDEGEDYSFLDPEPLTGYTIIEEIKFSLYATQAELNRLEKLLNTLEDVSRLQR